MNTTDKIMALANTYAASNGKALLEMLYGTSQSYTEQCAAEAFKDRQTLHAEIEALVRDAERYRWLRDEAWGGNNRSGPHLVVYRPGLMPSAVTELAEDAADTAIDAAMQEKQS